MSNETQYTRPDGYAVLEASQQVTIRNYVPGEQFYLYGSALRPMSASWARIPDAVFVYASETFHGQKYHTYAVVPYQLDAKTIASYELTVLAGPITWQPENSIEQQLCDAVWEGTINQISTRDVADRFHSSLAECRVYLKKIAEGVSNDSRFTVVEGGVLIKNGHRFTYGYEGVNNQGSSSENKNVKNLIWFLD